MAELIKQILTLPRAEQLTIVAQVIAHLQEEETEAGSHDPLPAWQLDLAAQSLAAIESGSDIPLSEEAFWKEVDTHLETLG